MKSLIRLSHYFPAVLLVIVIAVSCSKNAGTGTKTNSPDSTNKVTVTAAIVGNPWMYDTSGLDTNNDGKIDQGSDTSVIHTCQRDDTYAFNADYTGTVNTGTKHCTVGEAQTTPFTWSLSTDGKTLKSSFNSILAEGVSILTLDATHLSVYRDSTLLGVTYRYIVSLKR
jgi:hypothetical protein